MLTHECRVGTTTLAYLLDGSTLTVREGPLLSPIKVDLDTQRPVRKSGFIFGPEYLPGPMLFLGGLGLEGQAIYEKVWRGNLWWTLGTNVAILGFGLWQIRARGLFQRGTTLTFSSGDKLFVYDDGSETYRALDAGLQAILANAGKVQA